MNDDHDLETLLRRYQPVGPPPALRTRIVDSAVDRRRAWPWAVAAAALLAATVGLHMGTSRLGRQVHFPERVDERIAALVELEQSFGEGEEARELAARVMRERDLIGVLEAARLPVGASGGPR